MKPVGRPMKPLTEKEKKAIVELLSGDESYQEIADKYDMTKDSLRYKVNKYRKEVEKNEQENQ